MTNGAQRYKELVLTVPALLDIYQDGNSEDFVVVRELVKTGLIVQMSSPNPLAVQLC